MRTTKCTDPVILNLWHPIAALSDIPIGTVCETVLLEERLAYSADGDGKAAVWLAEPSPDHGRRAMEKLPNALPVKIAYGYVWTTFGDAPADLFPIPEYEETDRRQFNAASFGVNVSAPRAVENFLDLGHLPHVHSGILGAEPHTEVKEYDVEVSAERDEILATRCRVFQPKASAHADEGAEVEYIYRVPHPHCSVLYKSSASDPNRMDVVALLVQAVDQEHVRAHFLTCRLDASSRDNAIKRFQQTIFGQDKPILENQYPKRLPLDPRAETPIRSDKSAIAYRRWLSGKGVTYGVVPSTT